MTGFEERGYRELRLPKAKRKTIHGNVSLKLKLKSFDKSLSILKVASVLVS